MMTKAKQEADRSLKRKQSELPDTTRTQPVKVLVQPDDGVAPLLEGIAGAKRTIEIVIYRFDRSEIEKALKAAVARGVFVHALIAYTNRGGEKKLRKLEMRLLEAGVTVARTADDLARYHGKLVIIDRRLIYLLTFNYTYLDIDRSRSFGIITSNRQLVQEAVKLFEADTTRQPYKPALDYFIVSPTNAREQLANFIRGAQKKLLIYDAKLTDPQMIRLLQSRAKEGVQIKVIGRIGKRGAEVEVGNLPRLRLHAQTIIRDDAWMFIGSQSLRKVELDTRREVGLIIRDTKAVKRFLRTFEADWASIEISKTQDSGVKETKALGATPESNVRQLVPVLKEAIKETLMEIGTIPSEPEKVSKVVKQAVKEAVKETINVRDKQTGGSLDDASD
jgi:cardiolipin synthase